MVSRGALLLFAASLLAAAGGCARFTNLETEPPGLPAPRMSHGAVMLEMAVVPVPGAAARGNDPVPEIWKNVDELCLPAELRRLLAENGCRAGVIGGAMPTELRALLDRPADPENQLLPPQARQIPCRDGRRQELAIAPVERELVLLTRIDDKVRGQTFSNGQGLLALRASPVKAGGVKLDLTAELDQGGLEIHHGQAKQRYAGREGAFMLESTRPRVTLEALRLEAELAAGQMLLFTGNPEAVGLGRHLFANADTGERRLLLLRLTHTQHDGLFSQQSLAPVVTPSE